MGNFYYTFSDCTPGNELFCYLTGANIYLKGYTPNNILKLSNKVQGINSNDSMVNIYKDRLYFQYDEFLGLFGSGLLNENRNSNLSIINTSTNTIVKKFINYTNPVANVISAMIVNKNKDLLILTDKMYVFYNSGPLISSIQDSENIILPITQTNTISAVITPQYTNFNSVKVGIIFNGIETNYTMINNSISGEGYLYSYAFSSGLSGTYLINKIYVSETDDTQNYAWANLSFTVSQPQSGYSPAGGGGGGPSPLEALGINITMPTLPTVNVKQVASEPTGQYIVYGIMGIAIILMYIGITKSGLSSLVMGILIFIYSAYTIGLIQ